uniref:Protein TOPLESS-2 n=1 Tax=Rhizophora mucronata TaxID=61149 RepID=A0A2P2P937_RHIMU
MNSYPSTETPSLPGL